MNANSKAQPRSFARRLCEQMWGNRMVRYNKLSVHDRKSKKPNSRPSMKEKDPDGYEIYKSILNFNC